MARDFWSELTLLQQLVSIALFTAVLGGPRDSTGVLETWRRRNRHRARAEAAGRESYPAVWTRRSNQGAPFREPIN